MYNQMLDSQFCQCGGKYQHIDEQQGDDGIVDSYQCDRCRTWLLILVEPETERELKREYSHDDDDSPLPPKGAQSEGEGQGEGLNPQNPPNDFPYLVALMDGELKFKIACEDADSIQAAVAELCRMIGWNPLEHYDDFWAGVRATEVYDTGQIAWINLYESELIADMVVGPRDKIEELPELWTSAIAAVENPQNPPLPPKGAQSEGEGAGGEG